MTPFGCVLVTGATGAVGPSLVRRLHRERLEVRAVGRRQPPAGLLPDGVRFESADLSDGTRLADLLRGVDAVFHLAARLHVSNPPPSMRSAYERDNIEMTRRLVEQSGASARFVLFSTIDVYGPTSPPAIADESTAPQPRSLYGETKLAAESLALSHPGGVVLRVAAVYGSRVKGNYARLVDAIRRGRFITAGSGRNRRTLIYDEDLASAAWIAARDDRSRGRIYNATDGGVHTIDAIAAAIAGAAGVAPSVWHVPARPLKVAAAMVEGACRLGGITPPVTAAMVDKVQEDFAVSGARIQRDLGFRPGFDLRTGWAAALQGSTAAEVVSA